MNATLVIEHYLCISHEHRMRGGIHGNDADLPAPLIAEAMKATHQRTKTAVIVTTLEDLVRKSHIH